MKTDKQKTLKLGFLVILLILGVGIAVANFAIKQQTNLSPEAASNNTQTCKGGLCSPLPQKVRLTNPPSGVIELPVVFGWSKAATNYLVWFRITNESGSETYFAKITDSDKNEIEVTENNLLTSKLVSGQKLRVSLNNLSKSLDTFDDVKYFTYKPKNSTSENIKLNLCAIDYNGNRNIDAFDLTYISKNFKKEIPARYGSRDRKVVVDIFLQSTLGKYYGMKLPEDVICL